MAYLFPSKATGPSTPTNASRSVAVFMSGGVDSTIAAFLLKQQGYHVVGVTMILPSADDTAETSAASVDEDAPVVAVCRALEIPHYFVDVREEFRRLVIEPFRTAYREGYTPSPCIGCNARLKFGLVFDLIRKELGIQSIATGHYARVIRRGDGAVLFRALSKERDQSYFLYRIPRTLLSAIHFPLGTWRKEDVRRLADRLGLIVADRPDSVELCFAGQGDYRKALGPDVEEKPGEIVSVDGRVLGRHRGIVHFTVGQRRGLGIAVGHPLYVVEIDPVQHRVIVGDRSALRRSGLVARDVNVLVPDKFATKRELWAKIRSTHRPARCVIEEIVDDAMYIRFHIPQEAVAPGQHVVLYTDEGEVVAGGRIDRARSLS